MKFIIGLVGENGGGKGTFAEFLVALGAENHTPIDRVRSSDVLKETLKIWDLPFTRENLQKVAVTMVTTFGENALSNAVRDRIEASTAPIIISDAIRWKADERLIRSYEKHLLVYITADPKLRYERMRARKEKLGEDTMTFEQFSKDEQARTERDIPEIGARADVRVTNNGSAEDLKRAMYDIWQARILPLL